MHPIPLYDETKPISCTIGSDEIPARIELVERLRAHLTSIERTPHGMLLRFPARADVAVDLEQFAVDEKRCCEFWGFAISDEADGLVLRWDAPPAADELVAQLLAYFAGDEPISAIRGLL